MYHTKRTLVVYLSLCLSTSILSTAQGATPPANSEKTAKPPVHAFSGSHRLPASLLPGLKLKFDGNGLVTSITSPHGKRVALPAFRRATRTEPGYSESPAMNLLAKTSLKIDSDLMAAKMIAALHTITGGTKMVQEKKYRAHAVDGGWLVRVEHDFTTAAKMVRRISPYEIELDPKGRAVQIRQRTHDYLSILHTYRDTIRRTRKLQTISGKIKCYTDVINEEFRIATAKDEKRKLFHNSLRHYPDAVTVIKDDRTGESYYVESTGWNIFARNAKGATVRVINLWSHVTKAVGHPVVRRLELNEQHLIVTVGNATIVTVDRRTNKVVSDSAD